MKNFDEFINLYSPDGIPEGMPAPKTCKEWAIAKLCGLDFEPPKSKKPYIEFAGVVIDYDDDGTERKVFSLDGETIFDFSSIDSAEEQPPDPSSMYVMINGDDIELETFNTILTYISLDGVEIMALDFTQVEIEGLDLDGEIRIMLGSIISALIPKTPIEKYLMELASNMSPDGGGDDHPA